MEHMRDRHRVPRSWHVCACPHVCHCAAELLHSMWITKKWLLCGQYLYMHQYITGKNTFLTSYHYMFWSILTGTRENLWKAPQNQNRRSIINFSATGNVNTFPAIRERTRNISTVCSVTVRFTHSGNAAEEIFTIWKTASRTAPDAWYRIFRKIMSWSSNDFQKSRNWQKERIRLRRIL